MNASLQFVDVMVSEQAKAGFEAMPGTMHRVRFDHIKTSIVPHATAFDKGIISLARIMEVGYTALTFLLLLGF